MYSSAIERIFLVFQGLFDRVQDTVNEVESSESVTFKVDVRFVKIRPYACSISFILKYL